MVAASSFTSKIRPTGVPRFGRPSPVRLERFRGIPANATLVRYLPSGHLVYTRAGGLWAVAFDLETLESTGSPTIVLDDIYTNERNHSVAISKGGTLVYAVGESKVGGGFTLAWVDREGRVTPVAGEPGPYSAPVLSPDGSQLAVNLGRLGGIRGLDLRSRARDPRSRVGEQSAATPSWTPDGDRITYSTAYGIYSRRADGSGEPELVLPVSAGNSIRELLVARRQEPRVLPDASLDRTRYLDASPQRRARPPGGDVGERALAEALPERTLARPTPPTKAGGTRSTCKPFPVSEASR